MEFRKVTKAAVEVLSKKSKISYGFINFETDTEFSTYLQQLYGLKIKC